MRIVRGSGRYNALVYICILAKLGEIGKMKIFAVDPLRGGRGFGTMFALPGMVPDAVGLARKPARVQHGTSQFGAASATSPSGGRADHMRD